MSEKTAQLLETPGLTSNYTEKTNFLVCAGSILEQEENADN